MSGAVPGTPDAYDRGFAAGAASLDELQPVTGTAGQAAVHPQVNDIDITHDPEIPVHLVQLHLCDPCIDGEGEQCHTPGCSLFLNRPPDIGLRGNPSVTITAETPATAGTVTGTPRAFLDLRCGHEHHRDRGVYRMVGKCGNCTSEVLGLHTVGHEAMYGISGPECPVCGISAVFWRRMATPDEIPADFEAKP